MRPRGRADATEEPAWRKSSAAEACSTVEERRFERRVKRPKYNRASAPVDVFVEAAKKTTTARTWKRHGREGHDFSRAASEVQSKSTIRAMQ
jgi:hypothetical protein